MLCVVPVDNRRPQEGKTRAENDQSVIDELNY